MGNVAASMLCCCGGGGGGEPFPCDQLPTSISVQWVGKLSVQYVPSCSCNPESIQPMGAAESPPEVSYVAQQAFPGACGYPAFVQQQEGPFTIQRYRCLFGDTLEPFELLTYVTIGGVAMHASGYWMTSVYLAPQGIEEAVFTACQFDPNPAHWAGSGFVKAIDFRGPPISQLPYGVYTPINATGWLDGFEVAPWLNVVQDDMGVVLVS